MTKLCTWIGFDSASFKANQLTLRIFESTKGNRRLSQLMAQASFLGNESFQLMTQLIFLGVDSIQLTTPAKNHTVLNRLMISLQILGMLDIAFTLFAPK